MHYYINDIAYSIQMEEFGFWALFALVVVMLAPFDDS